MEFAEVKHRWIIEHFHEQELLLKLTSVPIQSAEFSTPDERYRFRMSLHSYSIEGAEEPPDRILTLYSLPGIDSFSGKVLLEISYVVEEPQQELLNKVIHLNKTKGVERIAEATLPHLHAHRYTDVLTVLCTVTIYRQVFTVCDFELLPTDVENTEGLVDMFKKCLLARTGTLLDIFINDCTFTASKSVSYKHSPLTEQIAEEERERILANATRFSCDSMGCMATYTYTQRCPF
ncbi:Aldose 1-epimerase [Trichuris trichiura]|uniref:Aldose 1-epimerase n=1 Tax=Trichuris trichiura TaxID=36087 RepID=A0A077Z073_TRITR|nr:Aldose 1-epimerase [Trichuris trichiura]